MDIELVLCGTLIHQLPQPAFHDVPMHQAFRSHPTRKLFALHVEHTSSNDHEPAVCKRRFMCRLQLARFKTCGF